MSWKLYEDHLLNEGLSDKRIKKLHSMFLIVQRGLGDDFPKADRAQIENFLNTLNRDQFRKQDGKAYSGSTKSDLKKFIKSYWKWSKGNNEAFPREVAWIKTAIRKDEKPQEKPIISQAEALELANSFHSVQLRVLTLILFDSGLRIDEALSIKKSGLTLETFDEEQNKCYWVQCTRSKTFNRKVPISLFTKEIQEFCNSAYYRNLEPDDWLFSTGYGNYLKALKRASLKVLGKRLSPHCLRHSSATLYAGLYNGDVIKLSQRFGWSYSANELKVYVRRSGALQKEGAKLVYHNQMQELQAENEKLKNRVASMEGALKSLQVAMPRIIKKFDDVIRLAKNRKKEL